MKTIIFLLLSVMAFGQSGKSVLTQAQKDSIGAMISDSNAVINDNIDTVKTKRDLSSFENGQFNLVHWNRDLSRTYYEAGRFNEPAKILVLGDSYGSIWGRYLAGQSRLTFGDGGSGYVKMVATTLGATVYDDSLNYSTAKLAGTNWTFTSTATDTLSLNGYYVENTNDTDSMYIVPVGRWNSIGFFYMQSPDGGKFVYRKSYNGTPDTIDTDGSLSSKFSYNQYTFEAGSQDWFKSDTIYVKAISGTVRIYGVNFTFNANMQYNSGGKVQVSILERSGMPYSYFTGMNGDAFTTFLDTLNPSLCILTFLEDSSASFRANLEALIDSLQAHKSDMDIMICSPNDISSNGGLADQRLEMQRVATEKKVAFLDVFNRLGSYANLNSLGLMTDGNHLSNNGSILVSKLIIENIFPKWFWKTGTFYVNEKFSFHSLFEMNPAYINSGIGLKLSGKYLGNTTWHLDTRNSSGRMFLYTGDRFYIYLDAVTGVGADDFRVYINNGATVAFNISPTNVGFGLPIKLENTNVSITLVEATPEGSLVAPIGSLAIDKANGVLYFKASGTESTGWKVVTLTP